MHNEEGESARTLVSTGILIALLLEIYVQNSLCSVSPQKQQAGSGVDHQAGVLGSQQTLTVMVQGQGQTSGQLQIIPQGVTVIPGPGQQLMQAALPGGQMQRFLFTPMASAATPTPSTGMGRFTKTLVLQTCLSSSIALKLEWRVWSKRIPSFD